MNKTNYVMRFFGVMFCIGIITLSSLVFSNKVSAGNGYLVKDADTEGTVSYALMDNGDLYFWGDYYFNSSRTAIFPLKVLENVKDVKIFNEQQGYTYTAITENGDLYCWGIIYYNLKEGGIWETKTEYTPKKVLENVKKVNIKRTSYAITEDGELYCWGVNQYGQVGNGTKDGQFTPYKVMNDVKTVFSKNDSRNNKQLETMYAIKENGDLYSWGRNQYGQVGDGTTEDRSTPCKILEKVEKMPMMNQYLYYCSDTMSVISKDGDLYSWGRNQYGQVGIGTTDIQMTPYKTMSYVKEIITDQYGETMSAITRNDDLYCWGYNKDGQVVNGTTENQLTPCYVMSNIKELLNTTEREKCCTMAAITNNDDLYLWGYNYTNQSTGYTPVKVLENIEYVCLNYHITMALSKNGDLYCWGKNTYGQVGNGNRDFQYTPYKTLTNVKEIVNHNFRTVVITQNGDLYCWGSNNCGQVGNGSSGVNAARVLPYKVLSNVKYANKDSANISVITEDGNLYCWGVNANGQSGNGRTMYQTTPYLVDLADPIGSISSTNDFSDEQTVTIQLSDNAGVSGYYWGTNNDYTQNTYKRCSSNTVTEKVEKNCIYYLNVRDINGRISNTSINDRLCISFKLVTLQRFDGKDSPKYILVQEGNILSLPILDRVGLIFKGWSENSDATSGTIENPQILTDSTYYAIWEKDTSEIQTVNETTISENVTKDIPKVNISKTKIKKITAKKKALRIHWKKVANADGYYLQYSLKKNFNKKKTVKIRNASTTSKLIKKLKPHKKYYVRIRTYVVVNKKIYMSVWSKIKSKKTK